MPDSGSDEYKRVLTTWALRALPAKLGAARVLSARADYYEGWGGTDITPGDDPELTLFVRYLTTTGTEETYVLYGNEDNALRMSDLLQDLFRLANEESV